MDADQPDPRTFNVNLIKETLNAHMYAYEHPLGRGGFASVHLVKSQRYNVPFCVKVSARPHDLDADGKSNEVETLFSLTAPCIIRMYEYFTDKEYLYVVLEYCPGGSLDDAIKKNGRLVGDRLVQLCRESAWALKACHDRHIAHRDIKPANLLLDQYDRLKLADFGLSQVLNEGQLMRQRAGSRPYMAPEILHNQPYDPFKADVWALGVTWYVLMMGRLPWAMGSQRELELAISVGMVDFGCSGNINHDLAKMIRKMITVDVRKRPDIDWVLQQEVMKAYAHPSRSDSVLGRRGQGLGIGRSPSMTTMLRSAATEGEIRHAKLPTSASQRRLVWHTVGNGVSRQTSGSYKLSGPLETFVE